MKVVARLLGYIRYRKGAAASAFLLALVVAALSFAQLPVFLPLFNTLFSSEQRSMERWSQRTYAAALKVEVAAGFATGNATLQRGSYSAGLNSRLTGFLNEKVLGNQYTTAEERLAHRYRVVIWAVVVIAALSFVKGLAQFLQEYTVGKVYIGTSRHIAADLYHHMLGLSMTFHHRVGSPSVVSRFTNDVEAVGRGLKTLFGKAILEPVLIAGYIAAAAIVNWQLLLLNIAAFPLLAGGVYYLGRKAKKATRRGLHSRDRLVNILQETFEGIAIVKAFNMERREERRFREENERVYKQDLRVEQMEAATSPFTEVVGVFAGCVSLVALAWFVLMRRSMDIGEVTVFYGGLLGAFAAVRKLSNFNNRIQALIAAADRVFEFLDARPDIVDAPNAQPLEAFRDEIRFENVSFAYDGAETVLKDVNLVAKRGEIVALVGPSGAGKTTIARLVPRFYDPQSGAVKIDGHDARRVTTASLRDKIGLVTQEVILFNDTIAGNISYGRPDASQAEIEAAAKAANAHGFITGLPDGYAAVVGEKGVKLSGGQRQRIALARAILKDPPILILDEATSSLDSESEFLIQQALDEFMKDRTSIVIAHRLSTIERASRIYVVVAGEVVDCGSNDELLARCEVYKRIYARQFRLAEA